MDVIGTWKRVCTRVATALIAAWFAPWGAAQVPADLPAAKSFGDDYCARFNPGLTPQLDQRIQASSAALFAFDAEQFESEEGRSARQEYFDLLSKYEDALATPPKECERWVFVPSEIMFTATSVDVYFATDREKILRDGQLARFGSARMASGVSLGLAKANLVGGGKCQRQPEGRIGYSLSEWKTRSSYGPPFVTNPQLLDRPALVERLKPFRQAAAPDRPSEALIFVHGFNVSFDEAIVSAAEIANCMPTDLATFVVSWPSAKQLAAYAEDEDSVAASRERLRQTFAWLLDQREFDRVTIVAHSMGTRFVMRALSDLALLQHPLHSLSRVVFAAPDIAEVEFVELWPVVSALPMNGWTIYVANNDLALWASTTVHRRPRIGDSRGRVFVAAPGDTVEASRVNSMARSYGHSYLTENTKVMDDLRKLIVGKQAASARGLSRVNAPASTYWELVP